MSMEYQKTKKEDLIIYTIKGDFSIYSLTELHEDIKSEIASGSKKYLIDLTKCDFMDSSGLGVIATIIKSKSKLKLVIDEKNEVVKRLTDLISVNFDGVGYFTDIDKAMDSFNDGGWK